jgi:hypothetical protein
MAEGKCTPRPWRADADGRRFKIRPDTPNGATLAQVTTYYPHEVAAANAALIVKAVNAFDPLVSALEGLVEIIDAAGVHNIMRGVPLGSVSWAVKTNDRLDAARAALSLAKDGTK